MLFSEIYSAYYKTVSLLIELSQKGELDSDSIYATVKSSAFPESFITIGSSIESGKWTLIKSDYKTNIKNPPTMPLSLLQKRWLKSLCADKRIRLFVDEETLSNLENQLENVEPLFTSADFFLYDKYSDGDPYEDSGYVENFRTILSAVHQKKTIKVDYVCRFGERKRFPCIPQKIEYSNKDDKFRVIAKVRKRTTVLNIARISSVKILEGGVSAEIPKKIRFGEKSNVTLEIYDERKALERVMLSFAHFEKRAVQIESSVYQLTIFYDAFDETELVVRVLSFGPLVKVLAPENFRNQVRQRIEKQMKLLEKK
ncbi:MAG: WYL domain-containing protein [Treponema sp.]|nr:WYL domain-containing protein [Treponema sp.]